MLYKASVKLNHNGHILDNRIIAVGEIEQDHPLDDKIMYYAQDESEMLELSNTDNHEFTILSRTLIPENHVQR